MARAYASLADGGYRLDSSLFGNEPLTVTAITHPNGSTVRDLTVPVSVPGLAGGNAAIEDQMLQGVVSYGTGVAAQIPGWQIAGKTGTTENYGDAWFVGFTPDLVTAVWVGYPNKLVPMLTEFHGKPVEGGTYPALIWKAYMQQALAYLHKSPTAFPTATIPSSTAVDVTFGDAYDNASLALDNGHCHISALIDFFVGSAPTKVANCLPNAVEVPDVRGSTLAAAESRLNGQPLVSQLRYRPATAGERLDLVVDQVPRAGVLSAYDKVTLVLPRPLHGVVPNLVGLPLARAQAALSRLEMQLQRSGPRSGHVVSQNPPAGVAAWPRMRELVRLGPGTGG
jgi:membrane peptidoglycan carboxypeptidase